METEMNSSGTMAVWQLTPSTLTLQRQEPSWVH
jgi:hypothetical protein